MVAPHERSLRDEAARMTWQNAQYTPEQAWVDAVAVATAVMHDHDSPELVDIALKSALEGTDHALLVYTLALLAQGLVRIIADGTNERPEAILANFATALAAAIDTTSGEETS